MKINDINIDSCLKIYGQTAITYSDISGNEIEIQHRISENLTDSTKPIFTKQDWDDFIEFQLLHAINYNTNNKKKRACNRNSTYDFSSQEKAALKAYYRHKTNDDNFFYFDAFKKSYAEIKSSILQNNPHAK